MKISRLWSSVITYCRHPGWLQEGNFLDDAGKSWVARSHSLSPQVRGKVATLPFFAWGMKHRTDVNHSRWSSISEVLLPKQGRGYIYTNIPKMMKSGNFHSSALYCSLMLNISDYRTPSPYSSLPWFFAFRPLTQFQLGSIFHNDNMCNAKALLPLASPAGTSCPIIVHSTWGVTQAFLSDILLFWLLVSFHSYSSFHIVLHYFFFCFHTAS